MATIKKTKYTHRFLARFIIEAKTPLTVGSGKKDITTDALIATDVNGLPYIPATSIAGVVRSMIGEEDAKNFFGQQSKKKEENRGSEIIFTEAKILDSKGNVVDGLNITAIQDVLLKEYMNLPIRQHVRINEKGVSDSSTSGKFDEQVVFAGTRFCFELEMVSDGNNYAQFETVLQQFKNKTFRLGGGTRCGFGEIEIISLQTRKLDLRNEDELSLYLEKSSNLATVWKGWSDNKICDGKDDNNWIEYRLNLQPEDFFLFSSGFGDQDADMTPVKTNKVIWNNDSSGKLSDQMVLIPATSVKGALAHRVAYHWNLINNYFVGNPKAQTGKENEAVRCLFGSEGEKIGKETTGQLRGNLLFSDVIQDSFVYDKILNHVAIDRFTGGAIDGALFSEKITYGKGTNFEMTILARREALCYKNENGAMAQDAFEKALIDICRGLLPLGGGVNRGNGVFTGTLKKNNEVIYPKGGGQ